MARAYYNEWERLWGALGPTVNFSSPEYSVGEWESSATVTVTLDATSAQTVTVAHSAVEATATTGSDFIAASGTLTFTPGITVQTFTVTVLDDTLLEPSETISLTLAQPTNATLGAIRGLEKQVETLAGKIDEMLQQED